ncbi:MAG: helix-turn-helix transcriptional regulator [Puniceicoccales bacterium]
MYFSAEPGFAAQAGSSTILHCPRLNICLAGRARYLVRRGARTVELALVRGDAVYTFSGCSMGTVDGAGYSSLGLVFNPELTRFMVARSNPEHGHRIVLAHHAPQPLDADGWNLTHALEHTTGHTVEYPLRLKLTEALLLTSVRTLQAPVTPQGKAALTWQAACQYIEEHLSRPLDRREVADFLQIHPNHLSRLFLRFGSTSFNQTVRDARLRRSRELLHDPGLNIAGIAQASGFPDANYFTRCFRQAFGQTPGEARQRLLAEKL